VYRPLDNSKILLKITTPYENYKSLFGRMGYKARQKHIFLDVYGENFKLGGEVLYLYKNLSNYNLKLRVNTPVDPLRQLLIAGKLNSELVSIWRPYARVCLSTREMENLRTGKTLRKPKRCRTRTVRIKRPFETDRDATFKLPSVGLGKRLR